MLFETRVSTMLRPGSGHSQHPGVKQAEKGILRTKSMYSCEISLYIFAKHIEGKAIYKCDYVLFIKPFLGPKQCCLVKI